MALLKQIFWPLTFVAVYYILTGVLGYSIGIGFLGMLLYLIVLALIFRDSVYTILGNLAHHKDLEKGLKYFKKAMDLGAKNPRPYLNHAILSLRKGEYDVALEDLELAEKLELDITEQKNLLLSKGTALWMAGRRQEAIKTLESMEEEFEYLNPDVLATLGYLYFAEGDFEKSEEMNERALEEAENLFTVWDTRGQIYQAKGELDKAKEAYEKAIEIQPHSLDALYGLSIILEDTHIEKAYEYILQAKELEATALHSTTNEKIDKQYEHLANKRQRASHMIKDDEDDIDENETNINE